MTPAAFWSRTQPESRTISPVVFISCQPVVESYSYSPQRRQENDLIAQSGPIFAGLVHIGQGAVSEFMMTSLRQFGTCYDRVNPHPRVMNTLYPTFDAFSIKRHREVVNAKVYTVRP